MKVLAFLAAFLVFTPLLAAETTLLEFTAKWCGPCREMEPVVAGLEREGYHIERLNIDQDPGRAKMREFHVQLIPTFVVLVDGRETGRNVGAVPVETLRKMLGPVGAARSETSRSPAASTASVNDLAHPISPQSGAGTKNELIRRSVRLVVDDSKSRSFGTGTVIRSVPGESLVLTCSHLFEGNSRTAKTTVEFFGAAESVRLSGEVVARDREADVSLVRVVTNQVFPAAPVAPKSFVPARGVPAISVGCDNGQQPSVRQMKIMAVNRYLGAPTIECSGEPVQGRSGGGLFNESGELIGVCSAAEPTEHRGIYGGLTAVQSLLDRQGLASTYNSRKTGPSDVVVASHERNPSETPLTLPPPEKLGLNLDGDLSIPANVEDPEVVCVIRPLTDPNAPARVIVLSHVSAEFLSQLDKEQASQGSRSSTSMRLPNRPDLHPVAKFPTDGAGSSAPSGDSSAWRPAAQGAAAKSARQDRSVIDESAKWKKDWTPGSDSPDSLGFK